jgi:hypothetical protein
METRRMILGSLNPNNQHLNNKLIKSIGISWENTPLFAHILNNMPQMLFSVKAIPMEISSFQHSMVLLKVNISLMFTLMGRQLKTFKETLELLIFVTIRSLKGRRMEWINIHV